MHARRNTIRYTSCGLGCLRTNRSRHKPYWQPVDSSVQRVFRQYWMRENFLRGSREASEFPWHVRTRRHVNHNSTIELRLKCARAATAATLRYSPAKHCHLATELSARSSELYMSKRAAAPITQLWHFRCFLHSALKCMAKRDIELNVELTASLNAHHQLTGQEFSP